MRASATLVSAVWLHQGLWCKLLRGDPRHEQILADVPVVGPDRARPATATLGAVEVGLAAWVLSGHRPRLAAGTQTALLVGMNAGGLLVSRERIPAPTRMVVRNLGFLALVWVVAARRNDT